MWKNVSYEQCLSFINCQLNPAHRVAEPAIRPAITISRLTGAGGRTVAAKLAEYLQQHAPVDCGWTVFDKNLMERVLEDHHISQRVAKYEPENHKPFIHDTLEEILGLHPSSWNMVKHTAETIWHLATMGNVILVGRGANVVTARLATAFHVRLVGSLERRTARVEEVYRLLHAAAVEFIKTEDKGRRRYLKEHYEKDIDDPLLYDLVLNTDRVTYDETARLIGDAVIHEFHLGKQTVAAAA